MGHEKVISLTEFKSDASGWIKRLQKQPPVLEIIERPWRILCNCLTARSR